MSDDAGKITWSEIMDQAGWDPDYRPSTIEDNDNFDLIQGNESLVDGQPSWVAAHTVRQALKEANRAEDDTHWEVARDDKLLQEWDGANGFEGDALNWVVGVPEHKMPGTQTKSTITESKAKSESKRRQLWQREQATQKIATALGGSAFSRLAATTAAGVTKNLTPAPPGGGGAAGGGAGGGDFHVECSSLQQAAELVEKCTNGYGTTASTLADTVERQARSLPENPKQDMIEQFNDMSGLAFQVMLALHDIGQTLASIYVLTNSTRENYEKSEASLTAGQLPQVRLD